MFFRTSFLMLCSISRISISLVRIFDKSLSRALELMLDSRRCFSETLMERCAATLSASRLGSSRFMMESSVSWGTFRFSLTYVSKSSLTWRISALISVPRSVCSRYTCVDTTK